MFGALRQTLAILLVYMGILLFDRGKNKRITRIFIYSSILVHVSMIPITIFFEIFMLTTKKNYKFDVSQLYSKGMAIYIGLFLFCIFFLNVDFIIFILGFLNLSDIFSFYANTSNRAVLSTAFLFNFLLFNWFNYLIILSIWIRRKKLLNSDVFIITQYFILFN